MTDHPEGASGLREVRIRGFRSARDARLAPGPVCALVGDLGAGKSNILEALRFLLDRDAPAPSAGDTIAGGEIVIEGTLADGSPIAVTASPPQEPRRHGSAGGVTFVRARERGSDDLVADVQSRCRRGEHGRVLLIEEPELFLRPHAQRYLYRLFHAFAALGNQVVYSTHSPSFLSVARLEEIAFVALSARGTTVAQRAPLPPDDNFQATAEFDAERSELFLARAALLVEGRTEKTVFPFVFRSLGYDADREAISIVECGGKSTMVIVARVAAAAGVPFVVVHDRDAAPGRRPIASERAVNAALAAVVPAARRVELAPDFESVAGLHAHSHKPGHAWQRFVDASAADVPEPLVAAVELVLGAAGGPVAGR